MARSNSQPPKRRPDPPHRVPPRSSSPAFDSGPHFGEGDDSKFLELFRQEIEEYEKREGATFFQLLAEQGVHLPSPQEVSDADVPGILADLIQALARLKVYLRSTDHLSDRQLYEALWSDVLREHRPPPLDPDDVCVLDLVSGGSAEDIVNWLRYYADDESRAYWQASFPDEPILPRERPPFDRDRRLPKPPRKRRKP